MRDSGSWPATPGGLTPTQLHAGLWKEKNPNLHPCRASVLCCSFLEAQHAAGPVPACVRGGRRSPHPRPPKMRSCCVDLCLPTRLTAPHTHLRLFLSHPCSPLLHKTSFGLSQLSFGVAFPPWGFSSSISPPLPNLCHSPEPSGFGDSPTGHSPSSNCTSSAPHAHTRPWLAPLDPTRALQPP